MRSEEDDKTDEGAKGVQDERMYSVEVDCRENRYNGHSKVAKCLSRIRGWQASSGPREAAQASGREDLEAPSRTSQ